MKIRNNRQQVNKQQPTKYKTKWKQHKKNFFFTKIQKGKNMNENKKKHKINNRKKIHD